MGWKSTEIISRGEAISLIASYFYRATNEELAEALESLGFGDNTDLPYFGCNFTVMDEVQPEDEW